MLANITLNILIFLALSSKAFAGITPEQVLGEYWKDPLFGEASSDKSVNIEILNDTVWPQTIKAKKGETLRILFLNKTDQTHLFAISENLDELIRQREFKAFVKEEVYHAQLNPITNGQHTHASTEIDTAKSIVLTIEENPTVLIPANDKKEILVKLDKTTTVNFRCVLDGHDYEKENGVLIIE